MVSCSLSFHLGYRRPVLMVALGVMVSSLMMAASSDARDGRASGAPVIPSRQALVVLKQSHQAFSGPSDDSRQLTEVSAVRPITGEATTLPVLQRVTVDRVGWLRVRLPGRPNGRTGWIRQRGTALSTTTWHLLVDTSTRRLTVFDHGRPIRTLRVIVGKPATPTPHGQFFVEEDVRLLPSAVGAPFALALSARSDVLQDFDGGPGQIALHGLMNVGGRLDTAASHGCVRLANDAVRWLVAHIAPGVPVTIT